MRLCEWINCRPYQVIDGLTVPKPDHRQWSGDASLPSEPDGSVSVTPGNCEDDPVSDYKSYTCYSVHCTEGSLMRLNVREMRPHTPLEHSTFRQYGDGARD